MVGTDDLESQARPSINGSVRRMPAGQLATLLEVSGALAATLDLPTVLQAAIASSVEVLALDTGAIYLVDGDDMYLGATVPALPPGFPADLRRAYIADHPHAGACLETGDPICVPDALEARLTEAERAVCDARGLRTILFVPLLVEKRPVGAVIVGSTGGTRVLDDDDIDLCRTLSYEISLAVANAQLFESMEKANVELARAYEATLEGWSRALEMRDEETSGHTQRVVELTLAIAERLSFPEADIVHLRRGAFLHDIGKMGVPDAILHKPAALTDEEWVVMRRHPEFAREFLAKIDYLAPALDVPYCHHERWDGSGYPQGLAAEDIPLSARVFAVVDVYDALTSDRVYRPAWTQAKALEHIREQAGKHFDPQVVDAFFAELDGHAW